MKETSVMASISRDSITFRKQVLIDVGTYKGDLPSFGTDIEKKIKTFKKSFGVDAFADLLRLSGAIPESIQADSSEEKRYSKFTDVLLSVALNELGLASLVLDERSDSADVEAVGNGINLVGDAKAFRLSRTAKNQKDFKVQAMHKWKNGKQHALLVCPIYQLPSSSSQIYHQAETDEVCIFTYSHLSILVRLASLSSQAEARKLLLTVLDSTFKLLTPSKSAVDYWKSVNTAFISHSALCSRLWSEEKQLINPTIEECKKEALQFYQTERTRIMSLSHSDAIKEILHLTNIDTKIRCVKSVVNKLSME